MNKQELISRDNKEALGKRFLKKGVDFAFEKSFGKSYEFFKEGLDILTCDCTIGNWLNTFDSNKELFTDINIEHTPSYEYFFVKSFIFSYRKSKKDLYLALDSIERYIETIKDEYGYYLMGKIYNSLEESDKALDAFYKAQEFSNNSRILYRIGRTKEENIELYGLEELYNSLIINSSSVCCARELKEYATKRGIELFDNENNLTQSFNEEPDEYVFHRLYEHHFNNKQNDSTLNDFITFLSDSNNLFVVINEENENEDYFDDYDHFDYHNDYTHPHDSPYYNDALDMDQQSPEFWDSL